MGFLRELKYRLFKTYYREKYLESKFLITDEDIKYTSQEFLKYVEKPKIIKETFTPRKIFIPEFGKVLSEPLYLKFYKTILEFDKSCDQLFKKFNLKTTSLSFLLKKNKKWNEYKIFIFSMPVKEIKFYNNKFIFFRKNIDTKNILKLTKKRLNSLIFYNLRAGYNFYYINKIFLEKGTFKIIPKIIFINLNKQISFGILLGFICHRPILKKYTLVKFKSNIITQVISDIFLGCLKIFKHIVLIYILLNKLISKKYIAKIILIYNYVIWLNIKTNLISFYIKIFKKKEYTKNFIINLKEKSSRLYFKLKYMLKKLFYIYINYIYTFFMLYESNSLKYLTWSKYFKLLNFFYLNLKRFKLTNIFYKNSVIAGAKLLLIFTIVYLLYLDIMYINIVWYPIYNYETFAFYIFFVIAFTILILQKFEFKYFEYISVFFICNLIYFSIETLYRLDRDLIFTHLRFRALNIDCSSHLKSMFEVKICNLNFPYLILNTEKFIIIFIIILMLITYIGIKRYTPFEKDFLSFNIVVEEDKKSHNLTQTMFFGKADTYDILRYFLWFEEICQPAALCDGWKNIYNKKIFKKEEIYQQMTEDEEMLEDIFEEVEYRQRMLDKEYDEMTMDEEIKERLYHEIGKVYKKKVIEIIDLDPEKFIKVIPWSIIEDIYEEELEEIYNNHTIYGALCLDFDNKVKTLVKKNKNIIDYYKIVTNDWWWNNIKGKEYLINLLESSGTELAYEEMTSSKEFESPFTKPIYKNMIPNNNDVRETSLETYLAKPDYYNSYYAELINKLVPFEDILSKKYGIHKMNRSIQLSQFKILDIADEFELELVNMPYQEWIQLVNIYNPGIFLEYWEEIADEIDWYMYLQLSDDMKKPLDKFSDIVFNRLLEDFIERTNLSYTINNKNLNFAWFINAPKIKFNISKRYKVLFKLTGK